MSTDLRISFGDDQFLKLIKESNWDLLCHHAAEATNYRSPDFNVTAAVENNTHRLPLVLDSLNDCRLPKHIVLTGSVFENDEGAGSTQPGRILALRPIERFYLADISLPRAVSPAQIR